MTLPKILKDLDAKARKAKHERRLEQKKRNDERKRKIRELNERMRNYGRD